MLLSQKVNFVYLLYIRISDIHVRIKEARNVHYRHFFAFLGTNSSLKVELQFLFDCTVF